MYLYIEMYIYIEREREGPQAKSSTECPGLEVNLQLWDSGQSLEARRSTFGFQDCCCYHYWYWDYWDYCYYCC